jgi:hypothetical protein
MIGIYIQAVSDKFNLTYGHCALAANIGRKADTLTIIERAPLSIHFDGDRRAIRALDPHDLDPLEIRTVIASGLNTGLLQLVGNVSRGEAKAFRKRRPPLEFIG